MKKQFGKLFIIFGVILCIFALVGCDLIFVDNPNPEKNPAEESSSETVETSEDDEYPGEEISETEYDANDTYVEETFEDVLVPDEGLIPKLIVYLNCVPADIYLRSTSLNDKINRIKQGQQPLQVVFDSNSDYYFVCAYFNSDHTELYRCCCAEEYTWVGFKNAEDIPEYYKGEQFLVAFQVNKASFVNAIASGTVDVQKVENFKRYFPEFKDGSNIAAPIVFEDKLIYFNYLNESVVYFSTDFPTHYFYSLNYIQIENKDYICVYLCYYHNSGEESFDQILKNECEKEYGEYYDRLTNIMTILTRKHDDKTDEIYALFEIDEFVDKVLN